ncbi:MAG: hypothetical protein JWS10_594 [Cypionkella sp.]|nr:hypothetical protein [Cypionkella sp.]
MIFELKSIPFELVIMLNDDEATPTRMIGKKWLRCSSAMAVISRTAWDLSDMSGARVKEHPAGAF